jgi:RNA polymerase sigma-70 factor (ECF subfamily)
MDPAARDSAPVSEEETGDGVNEAPPTASKGSHGPPAAELDDRELVERVQSGDSRAFRLLFDRYHRRAYAVAYGVVKNKQDALDVVQDGFVKVHRHIGKFQGNSSFYTWLYRIVMNLAIDHVRRRKNAKGLEYDDAVGREADEVAGDGTLLPRVLDANPGKTVVRRELLEKIQAALDELPEYHRAVILLREIEGLSYEEMAQTLGVPKGTIMSRLFHARKKMQAALSDYMEGDLTIEE